LNALNNVVLTFWICGSGVEVKVTHIIAPFLVNRIIFEWRILAEQLDKSNRPYRDDHVRTKLSRLQQIITSNLEKKYFHEKGKRFLTWNSNITPVGCLEPSGLRFGTD